MESTEQGARARHGNLLYNLTWQARKGEQKWLWIVVMFFATLRFAIVNVVIFAVAGAATGWIYHDQLSWASTMAGAVSGVITSPMVEPLFRPHWTISAISSYYSIAADMKRSPGGIGRKFLYLVSGGAAVVLAGLVLLFHRKSMTTEKFYITELDVLGNVFSKAGWWQPAMSVFHEMEDRYYDCPHTGEQKRQCAISYALACKWLMGGPYGHPGVLKRRIAKVMNEYPDLPEEVTMRLTEAFK